MKKMVKCIGKVARVCFALLIAACVFCACSDDDSGGGSSSSPSVTTNSDGSVTIKIEEGQDGLMATNGAISSGSGASNGKYYANFPSSAGDSAGGAYIKYNVYTNTAGTYTLTVRYAFAGYCDYLRDAIVYINGIALTYTDGSNGIAESGLLEFGYTQSWSTWADATVTCELTEDYNTIALYAADGTTRTVTADTNWSTYDKNTTYDSDYTVEGTVVSLPNIDYITLTSPQPTVTTSTSTDSSGNQITTTTTTAVVMSAGDSNCTYWSLTLTSNNTDYGTVKAGADETSSSLAYMNGTSVTVTASALDGYVFDCFHGLINNEEWTGSKPTEADSNGYYSYTFTISGDTELEARFIPSGWSADSALIGYGAICDDDGTGYTITGGYGGEQVTIRSCLSALAAKADELSGDEPYIFIFSGTITTDDNASVKYNVGSNKTIYGTLDSSYVSAGSTTESGNQGRLKNVELQVTGENVIIRNMMFGEVISDNYYGGSGDDALCLNAARHVWIDHCEFQSHLSPQDNSGQTVSYSYGSTSLTEDEDDFAKDFYDGLLDIKNGSSFVTISNCYFHDHWKAVLCGSSDTTENNDTLMRLTFYNNYWKDINARQPLFRYGKAHIFSSYFTESADETLGQATAINCRAGSEVYIDHNYFENIKTAIGFYNDTNATRTGTWHVEGNEFSNVTTTGNSSTNSSYTPPYKWSDYVTSASNLPSSLPGATGVGHLTASDMPGYTTTSSSE